MIGQVLGHFTVIAKLGEGGQGTVYLATDKKLERKVALKILLPQALEDESLYRRFILEAKAAASLDHPNICTVYSIEEVNEQTLLAMAYLEGETIRQKLEHGPLPLDEAVDFALQTLRGLDAAHKEGIVHRDIKSSNLMVVDQGSVKVLDFGLAVAANRTRITATNTVLGTPRPTCHLSRSEARRSITGRICGRSASFFTKWSRAVSLFAEKTHMPC